MLNKEAKLAYIEGGYIALPKKTRFIEETYDVVNQNGQYFIVMNEEMIPFDANQYTLCKWIDGDLYVVKLDQKNKQAQPGEE